MIGIYKTILKSTGRVVYVGQTTNPHLVGKHYFGSGIHKRFNVTFRKEHFSAEIIITTESQEEANELERYYIEYFCTLEEYGGFNIEKGGKDCSVAKEVLTNRKDLSKPVLQFTKDGTFVAEYPSLGEAERQTGIAHQHISSCCNGKLKSAGGYRWRRK